MDVEIFKCTVCGNVIEVLYGMKRGIVCCDKKMFLMEPNSKNAAREKHIPVIEKTDDGIIVKVGEMAHPMQDNHYIVMIEVIDGSHVHRKNLKFSDAPEVEFNRVTDKITARAYCNLHGLWETVNI